MVELSTLKRTVSKIHKIYCISGRTASGKSSITKLASEKLGLKVLKSYATRPMRDGEEIESDHIFIQPEEVEKYRGDMVAYTKIGEYEYFATKEQLMNSDVYIIDPVGIYELLLKTKGMDINIETIYVTVPKRTLIERAKQRKDDMEVFNKRFDSENQQFTDYEKSNMIHYRILNDGNIEDSVEKMIRIISKDREMNK